MSRAHRLLTVLVVLGIAVFVELVHNAVDGHASPENWLSQLDTDAVAAALSGTVSCEFLQQELAIANQALAADTMSVELHDSQVALSGLVAGVCY